MITSCDPIDPYTKSGTFGVSYNGGYKPDKTLQWVPPDTNVVDDRDDFVPPPLVPPPNMLMQTCEGKRVDPRIGGIPRRDIQYDNFTESVQENDLITIPIGDVVGKKESELGTDTNMLIFLIVILLVVLFITKLS